MRLARGQEAGRQARKLAGRFGSHIALHPRMSSTVVIGIRYVWAGSRRIPVLLSRNEGGSFAAQCLLGSADRPIIDGASPREALAATENAIEGLLFARQSSAS